MSKEKLFLENEILLSTTDLDSRIKYANKDFCKIAGYSIDEMKGNPHNMVRHPDMPKAVFKDLWQYVQAGKSWMGPIKNSCKNGDYYWVNAFVTPIKDSQGKIFEYQSIRTLPKRETVERAEQVYKKINAGKNPQKLTTQTDITLWFQLFFICSFAFSLLVASLSDISFFLSGPMVVISALFTVLFFKWRSRFKKLTSEAKSVFDNPLISYIYSGNNDALSAISLALKKRSSELKAVVGRVCDVSGNVTKAAKESSQCGIDVSTILAQQNNETEQVATAMHQMSSTAQDLTRVVKEAAHASQQGLDISNQGKQIVEETISANNGLAEQLNEVEQAIEKLVNGSKSIETVLNEINGIADQTNLLALNAAIEAARAGEHGRGFAVVADEVRALAMRTQQSTGEINQLLAQLQSESESANNAMEKGTELSQSCVHLSEKTGDSLNQIIIEVSQLASLNSEISTAISEQSVVNEEIRNNIVAISEMSATTEGYGQKSVKLSDELLEKLKDQQALITQFI